MSVSGMNGNIRHGSASTWMIVKVGGSKLSSAESQRMAVEAWIVGLYQRMESDKSLGGLK